MKPSSICDYTDYDYKGEFWDNANRLYEDLCERSILNQFLSTLDRKDPVIMDAGCGFGRLFSVYQSLGSSFILCDYAQTLLDQAQSLIGDKSNVTFLQGDITQLPLDDEHVDCILSVRTLHHLDEAMFFNEMYRLLKPGGLFIFEIPNKRHILNVLRYALGKLSFSPFTSEPVKLDVGFRNYHPDTIFSQLDNCGFQVIRSVNTSYFRNRMLKRVFPARVLVALDRFFQLFLSRLNLAPSIFVLCKKP